MSEKAQGRRARSDEEEAYRARNRTHQEIRQRGAIGSLNDGIEIEPHGIRTRLIAWPGNGFQTLSVHVFTHQPGDETPMYGYGMAEEATMCLKGKGEVFLRGRWVELEPGDIRHPSTSTSRSGFTTGSRASCALRQ